MPTREAPWITPASNIIDEIPDNRIKSPLSGGLFCYCTYFNGLVDDVRIYNRALSPDEIEVLAGF